MFRKIFKSIGILVPVLLLLFYFTVVVCFLNRWDSVVPFTLIPFWLWTAIGAALSLLSWILFRHQISIIIFIVWLVTGIAFSYETRGMFREMAFALSPEKPSSLADREPDVFRIISVHCRDGDADAALETVPYDPDIIFLQRSPLLSELTEIGTKIYGVDAAIIRTHTNAIIARGEFLTTQTSEDKKAQHARLRLTKGQIIDLTNIELPRSLPTFKLWDTARWEPLILNRVENRKRMRKYLEGYNTSLELPPRIVGGDFGTSPGDNIFRPLKRSAFSDGYNTVGSDWGNTYPASTPFFRHTQFWLSNGIQPVRVRTVRSKHSDQKIVICDFKITVPSE